ncbi:rifin PIR protein, putative [Plasmodium reichenowi]|uniref:Rifin PIR protein, putative n=1 Tax=Plasmodium reichenowi TaxID=5854 RepID=A0A2P9DSY8_PLARE|nr:rifin PIR protein, putative [Plasmodium reichenowi]
MKVHYINILLFALPLNILEHNQRNHKSPTPHHTLTTRLLCECELYAPANYDNDPQMKEVMQQFEDRTSQRFEEYDDRMKNTRQKCKDKCDKEIQKIILKDKLEKELMDKFATLHTDIQSDDIPTCICEKSIADKMEKFCLNCGVNVGGGVTLSSGVLGGIGEVTLGTLRTAALIAAKEAAEKAGIAAGKAAGEAKGMEIVMHHLENLGVKELFSGIFEEISRIDHFSKVTNFAESIYTQKSVACSLGATRDAAKEAMCSNFNVRFGFYDINNRPVAAPNENPITKVLNRLAEDATQAADAVAETTSEQVTTSAIETSTEAIDAASTQVYTGIGYSVLAIIIIVLIMVIIYLILRYRRKKKMKKKLQYIKLLEE